MKTEYLYKNIEFTSNIAKEIIPAILLKYSTLKREKLIERVYLYHILNGGLETKNNEKSNIKTALIDLKEKEIVEQPKIGYYQLTEKYQTRIKLGEDSLIKLPFEKQPEEEVKVEDLETEVKNICFDFIKTLSLEERKNIYTNILEKYELKSFREVNYENEKVNIDKLKLLIEKL